VAGLQGYRQRQQVLCSKGVEVGVCRSGSQVECCKMVAR
jgi:hypothetical protein